MLPFLTAALITATTQPNIVLIVADDLGYGELGCYGGTQIPTPNIDAIAANGVRMSQGYVSAPMCAPSRAGLMTGRYQQKFGFEYNQPKGYYPNLGLPTEQVTLPERLRALGYATGMVGKWHLGEADGMRPLDQGFDRFYGILGGASPFLPYTELGLKVYDDTVETRTSEYLTDALSDRAVSFVNEHAGTDRPFFLCLTYNAVHKPYQAPQEYLDRFPSLTDNRRIFAAMLSALDDGVGRVRQAVADHNALSNTVFVFISDNGGMRIDDVAHNDPLRGVKGTVLEGGIRVPYIISWPFKVPQGVAYDYPVSTLDLVPTLVGAAGYQIPGIERLDGKNLLPFIRGQKTERPHQTLYWKIGNRIAIREGDMKYASWNRYRDGKLIQKLYDLNADPGEVTDLRFTQQETKEVLRKKLKAWTVNLPPPMWTVP